ncbi:MAG: hypothetical protein IJN70_03265 [Clostridia bacterium]|nr:hypothetical protein [Clostridia bacterium]
MNSVKKALAVILALAAVLSFSGCLKYTSNILEVTTRPNMGGNNEVNTTIIYVNPTPEVQTTLPVIIPEITTQPVQQIPEVTTQPVQQIPEATTQPAVKDPSTWTTAEILKFTTDAVTKTKAYTNQVTVDHEEAFDIKITKAPGGKLVMDAADSIIASVAKPSKETLTFTNGRTTNGEGENVPLLLPKRGAFTLTADGIATAYAKKSGNDTIVHIQLVKEVGTLTDHPKHHAASLGYLDASDVDLGTIQLNYLDITYSGSTMDFVIGSDGYVKSVDYKIPIHIAVEARIFGITAGGECQGSQSEFWTINW